MKKKSILVVSSALLVSIFMTGCGDSKKINSLKSISALGGESKVSGVNLSVTDQEAAVYAQVSDRELLDLTNLQAINSNDEEQIMNYMNLVDSQLNGTVDSKNGVIDSKYIDYLLMEFEKTPYYWQRSKMDIRGVDSVSGSIIVDVTFKTIGYAKSIQADSKIALGEPDYNQKMEVRYNRWLALLDAKYSNSSDNYTADWNSFVSAYGEPNDILSSQRDLSLSQSIVETGNQKTYNGLTDSNEEKSGATMVVRFIVAPNFTLGINQGYNCNHMYILNYSLDSDPTSGKEMYNEDGSATVVDSVYNTLYRYYQCIDESNFSGLYSLTNNFASLDKYFSDYFETTYRKHENFTLSIFSIKGTSVECGVTLSRKVRAKGSNMSLPIYKDKIYYTLSLIDGQLKVTNEVLISEELEGEPRIGTTKLDTTGFTSSVNLSDDDKKDIENLIANFGAIQLSNDTTSDKFSSLVDTSLSESSLSTLKKSMQELTGVKRVTWLVSYLQGQSNYASVKCRELFQHDDNSVYEAEVVYDFINKGNKWFIYSYTINTSAKLDTTNLATSNCLCIVTPNSVDELTSQVTAAGNNKKSSSLSSVGSSYTFKSYMPNERTGSQELGYKLNKPSDVTDDDIISFVKKLNGKDFNEADFKQYLKEVNERDKGVYKVLIASYRDYISKYISKEEFTSKLDSYKSNMSNISTYEYVFSSSSY